MGLLYRRYLAAFAFVFLLFSLFATVISSTAELWVALVLLVCGALCCLWAVMRRKHRFGAVVAAVCLISASAALFNSFASISLKEDKLCELVGENAAQIKIISTDNAEDGEHRYLGRTLRIGEEGFSAKCYVTLESEWELSYGDRLMLRADIYESGESEFCDGILLRIYAAEEGEIFLLKEESPNYFCPDGIVALSYRLHGVFAEYVDAIFEDKATAGLVKGFLINDIEDLSGSTVAAFRRSGTSHLLAVSGLHIILLLGSLELLLRLLGMHRKLRCICVTLFGLFFIALTEFAPSAVRAFLMLLAVYLNYMLAEEGDAVTSLFTSVALIVLVSPFAIYDIGMLMSFLATLGLVTVYPLLERRLPRIKIGRGVRTLLAKGGSALLKTLLMTLVATFFLLPISWYCFGSVSLSSFTANLVLSPITTVFMPLCALSLIFVPIPLVGEAVELLVDALGALTVETAGFFAALPASVLSLKYPFVPFLMLGLICFFTLMMFLRLRRKILLAVLPTLFVVCFTACLGVFNFCAEPQLTYVSEYKNDFLILEEAGNTCVFDMSGSTSRARRTLSSELPVVAVEIDRYYLTELNEGSTDFFDTLMRNIYVRKLYLPHPRDAEQAAYATMLSRVALEYGTQIELYDSGEMWSLYSDVDAYAYYGAEGESYVMLMSEGERFLTYCSALESDKALDAGAQSKLLLLGEHGESCVAAPPDNSGSSALIISSRKRLEQSGAYSTEMPRYILSPVNKMFYFSIPLKG